MKLFIIPVVALIAGLTKYSLSKMDNKIINKPLNTKTMLQDTAKKPTVYLEKVILNPMTVLFISDTAADMTGLSKVFAADYGELFAFINQNGLKPGKVLAFYFTYVNPISMEAAVEVDNIPAILTGRIKSKIVEGGDAIVAHYTGPYEEMEIPYNAIAKWVTDNNKQAKGLPFEAYLNGPDMVKDKYELKTDIYQLLK